MDVVLIVIVVEKSIRWIWNDGTNGIGESNPSLCHRMGNGRVFMMQIGMGVGVAVGQGGRMVDSKGATSFAVGGGILQGAQHVERHGTEH